MFPIRDENPTYSVTYATYIIIGVNIAVWIFVQGAGFNPELAQSVCRFGLIPGEILGNVDPGTRIQVGKGVYCVMDGSAALMTPITSMFMHGGWFHLIGNMWFLGVFGDNVEDAMGSIKFVVFYILCGLSAAALQMFSAPSSTVPMVGASGAIGGVMGAYAVLYPRAPVHLLVFFGFFITRIVVPAFFMLGYWFLLQFMGGFFSLGSKGGVAFWAHIGGFAAGIGFLKFFCGSDRVRNCRLNKRSMNNYFQKY